MRRNASPLSRSIRLLFAAALIAGAASITAHTLPAARAAAGDPQTCEQASGDEAIAACTRAIASGAYQGHDLAKLPFAAMSVNEHRKTYARIELSRF